MEIMTKLIVCILKELIFSFNTWIYRSAEQTNILPSLFDNYKKENNKIIMELDASFKQYIYSFPVC